MSYVHGESIIRIALADDDLTLQDLLPAYIDSIENCKVVLQATNGKELLERLKRKPDVDLVIMDIRMPEINGYDAAKKIKQDHPGIKILFSSIYHNELVYCQLIGIGVDGFIRKGSSVSEIKRCIMEIMKNGTYFPGFPVSMNRKRINGNGKSLAHRPFISDEELKFLKLVCTDKTYDAIADEMKCPLRHTEYIRQGLFDKFEVRNRVELALFAYKGGVYH